MLLGRLSGCLEGDVVLGIDGVGVDEAEGDAVVLVPLGVGVHLGHLGS